MQLISTELGESTGRKTVTFLCLNGLFLAPQRNSCVGQLGAASAINSERAALLNPFPA